MRKIKFLIATFIVLIISGMMLFHYFHVSKKEAINIVENHARENYKQFYINDSKLKIGDVIKVEETFDENGNIPPRWKVDLITKEGQNFATYWINISDGKFGYGLSNLGDEMLINEMMKSGVGKIIVTEERKLGFGETMSFADVNTIVLKKDGVLNVLLENRTDQKQIIKIEFVGDTTEIKLKTVKSKEKLEDKMSLGNINKVVIYDSRGNRAIWD